ncbi:MAG: UDP-3-O-(3-hydroxymyristoyl)glucosamine N-acyltransferase [Planctomycetota bacterium]
MAFVPHTLGALAEAIGAELAGDPAVEVRGVAGLAEAEPGDLTFLANPKYVALLAATRATAAIVGRETTDAPCALLRVANPDLAFAQAVGRMAPPPPAPAPGVHPSAWVAPDATLGTDAAVGPHAVVDAGAALGDRAQVWAGAYVGPECVIGPDAVILPHAVVCHGCRVGARAVLHPGAVVGSDGFGYAWDGARYVKIPQVGTAVVEDDAEVGACTTIDRARFGETVVGTGSKLDNLIQIAHNVRIGPHCGFAAQVGIAGSTTVGAYTQLGGRVGILGHLSVGDAAQVSAMAGVTKSLPGGEHYTGYPARPHEHMLEDWRHIKALGRLRRTVRDLERRIAQLEAETEDHR